MNTALQLAHGYLLGYVICTLLLRLWDFAGWPWQFWDIANVMLVGCMPLAGIIILNKFSTIVPGHSGNKSAAPDNIKSRRTLYTYLGICLLVALIAMRFYFIAAEALVRPIFAWDAWYSWTPMTIQFFDGGSLQAPMTTINPSHGIFANLAHLWSFLAAGTTQQTLTGLPWVTTAVAITIGVYGLLREASISLLGSLLGCYIVISMPFFDIHSMLVGYADIWLTLAFFLGLHCCLKLQRRASLASTLSILFYAIVCISIKQSGFGLAFILFLAAGHVQLSKKRRGVAIVPLLTLLAIAVILWLPGSNLYLQFNTMGGKEFLLSSDRIVVFDVMTLRPKEYTPIGAYIVESLLLFLNWHLLYFLAGVTLALQFVAKNWHSTIRNPVPLATCFGLIYTTLYHGMIAPDGAEGHQGLSRSMLYFAPSLACWMTAAISDQLNRYSIRHL
jgi:hypothetical protein